MIGNLSTEIDAKEQYMTAIAPILPEGVKRIKEYIQDMVQIDQKNGKCILSPSLSLLSFSLSLSTIKCTSSCPSSPPLTNSC